MVKIELHRGICDKCNSGVEPNYIKANWVMCYRLPIKVKVEVSDKSLPYNDFETGQHFDLCLICIQQEFKNYA